jgi:REP element-mobilizing transposase RayT
MINNLLAQNRKSHVELNEIYFWTATIRHWFHLLRNDCYKDVVIDSLQYLTDAGKINVFGFVIMPNHLHFIWRILELNGKESPQGSFLKYTAHKFKEMLRRQNSSELIKYKVHAPDKEYEFWKRDSLAIPLYTKKVAIQKLRYTHNNPIAERWKLATDPCDYKYSSARFYELNEQSFPFLKDIYLEF